MTPKRKRFYSSPSTFIISLTQGLAARIFNLKMRFLGGLEIKSKAEFNAKDTYLVISNHVTKLDPFAIFGSYTFGENVKTAPMKFLTAKTEYYSVLLPLLKCMGCYPTKNRKLTVPETVNLLKQGYSVTLFPEGRLTTRQESNPRDGTKLILDMLRAQGVNVKIIMVHIQWTKKRFFRRVTVSSREATPEIYEKSMKEIMESVYEV